MRSLFAVFIGLLSSFVAYGAFDCSNEYKQQYMYSGAASGQAPDKIYNFEKIRVDLLSEINSENFNQDKAQCLSDFYDSTLQEVGGYWGEKLAQSGCETIEQCEADGTNQNEEFVHSAKYLDSLSKEFNGKLKQVLDKKSEKVSETPNADLALEVPPVIKCKKDQATDFFQIQAQMCCNEESGHVRAIYPEDSFERCIDRIKATNKSIVSVGGFADCLSNGVREALVNIYKNITLIFTSIAELWGARAEIKKILTDSDAAAEFLKNFKSSIVKFINERSEGVMDCLNQYEQSQYVCEVTGAIIGTIVTPAAITKFLGIAKAGAGKASAFLAESLAKTDKGRKVLSRLDSVKSKTKSVVEKAKQAKQKLNKTYEGTKKSVSKVAQKITEKGRVFAQKISDKSARFRQSLKESFEKYKKSYKEEAYYRRLVSEEKKGGASRADKFIKEEKMRLGKELAKINAEGVQAQSSVGINKFSLKSAKDKGLETTTIESKLNVAEKRLKKQGEKIKEINKERNALLKAIEKREISLQNQKIEIQKKYESMFSDSEKIGGKVRAEKTYKIQKQDLNDSIKIAQDDIKFFENEYKFAEKNKDPNSMHKATLKRNAAREKLARIEEKNKLLDNAFKEYDKVKYEVHNPSKGFSGNVNEKIIEDSKAINNVESAADKEATAVRNSENSITTDASKLYEDRAQLGAYKNDVVGYENDLKSLKSEIEKRNNIGFDTQSSSGAGSNKYSGELKKMEDNYRESYNRLFAKEGVAAGNKEMIALKEEIMGLRTQLSNGSKLNSVETEKLVNKVTNLSTQVSALNKALRDFDNHISTKIDSLSAAQTQVNKSVPNVVTKSPDDISVGNSGTLPNSNALEYYKKAQTPKQIQDAVSRMTDPQYLSLAESILKRPLTKEEVNWILGQRYPDNVVEAGTIRNKNWLKSLSKGEIEQLIQSGILGVNALANEH